MKEHNASLDMKELGTFVRAKRKKHNFTQKILADRLKITQGQLSKVENGFAVMTATQFIQFCRMIEFRDFNKVFIETT